MKCRLTKRYILFILLLYTFVFNELLCKIIPLFKFEDELFAVLAIPLGVMQYKKLPKLKYFLLPLAGYAVCGLIGNFKYKYQPFFGTALPDMFLCLKFWLCIYVSTVLFKGFNVAKFSKRIYFHIKLIVATFFVLSLLNILFDIFPHHDVRFGLGSNSIFYEHPITLLGTCSLLIAFLAALRAYCKIKMVWIVMLLLILISTLRGRAFSDALLFGAVYVVIVVKKGKFSLKYLLPLVPVAIYLGWSQFSYYFFHNVGGSARAQLFFNGLKIAKDHFPVGAGFGTYGSYYSAIHYSPLYFKYKMNKIYGLSKEEYSFICDSFWPVLFGETGFIGTAFYCTALGFLTKTIMSLRKLNLHYCASGICMMIYLFIESTSGTAFFHPLGVPFAIWLGILLTNSKNFKQTAVKAQTEDILK